MKMKTESIRDADVQRAWLVVDLEGKVLGRVATHIAAALRGKNKAYFTPHVDCGDHVVVINAEKVAVTGRKEENKKYWWHTGWVGSIHNRSVAEKRETDPAFLITNAVKGMLPKNRLGRQMLKKLHVYVGPEHKHEAQTPVAWEI
jgi:large subunit ribosomal protein L13